MNKAKSQMLGSNLDSHGALHMKPVKRYGTPGYPTYSVASGNPVLLEKLPSRWQENAKVIACIGVFGTVVLAGADEIQCGVDTPKSNASADILKSIVGKNDARVRIHFGGSGGAPFYIVYVTEQEALSAIREEAEEAGLTLISTAERPRLIDFRQLKDTNAFLISGARLKKLGGRGGENPLHKNRAEGMQWKEFLTFLKEQTKGDAMVRLHYGGSGTPFYVVYLMEQEALSIIRKEAEAAGIEMSKEPYIEYRPFSNEIEKLHKNAFAISGAGLGRLKWRGGGNAFQGNGADGMEWKEFLELLKAQTREDNKARVRIYNGGAGGSLYVVYLTEQEALPVIRAEAKAAGLDIVHIHTAQNHPNAFAINPTRDRNKDVFLRSMRSESVRKAFQESGIKGVPWKEFLMLLKEQKDEK